MVTGCSGCSCGAASLLQPSSCVLPSSWCTCSSRPGVLYLSFFLFMQTPVARYSARVESADLPCPCHGAVSVSVFRQCWGCCHVCSSTWCCSTWSPPLWLFREKATPLYFQHPLILCVSTQKLKFHSKVWNVCKNGRAESRGAHSCRAACPWSSAETQELYEIRLSISHGFPD